MDPFPDDVLRFLDSNIESIDQLEILRVLAEQANDEWSANNLAQKIQAGAPATIAHLTAMQARGLLAVEVRDEAVYARYGPSTPELDKRIVAALASYREKPVSMIKYVYARAAESLRAFADAFKLRKES